MTNSVNDRNYNERKMKKIALVLVAFVMAQCAMAQQFSLPILPEKMWPSEYANYEADVLNCCDYLLGTDPSFNAPKHEECASFLLRWAAGSPNMSIVVAEELVDAKKGDLLLAYIAGWARHSIKHPEDNGLLCANVAVADMLNFYFAHKDVIGKSKLTDKLLKKQEKGELASYITKVLVKE